MIATVPSMVALRTDTEYSVTKRYNMEYDRKEARSTSAAFVIVQLLAALGMDFINQFLVYSFTTQDNRQLATLYWEFSFQSDMTLNNGRASWSLPGEVSTADMDTSTVSIETFAVFQNFAAAFWSAVLLDLGATSGSNMLTDLQRFRQVMHSNFNISSPGLRYPWMTGTGIDSVINDPAGFGLPMNNTQPASFNARYLCRNMEWKSPGSLAADVLVATFSFFMAYWTVLNLGLKYFAIRASTDGQST
ncbi:hypothetical protein FRC12_000530 [Ceratobasidium sp. 428]|nr:hypothetical protein FRC12_000530 [Ceratobasidium sp. 428]